jgi:crotonobetainyl-CoA:carnitine CoA-transferase CaiB-like acyl-CoA transferase
MSELDLGIRFRAPLIGEHNQEIYRELGILDEEIRTIEEAGVI